MNKTYAIFDTATNIVVDVIVLVTLAIPVTTFGG